MLRDKSSIYVTGFCPASQCSADLQSVDAQCKFMKLAREQGLVLNKSKCEVKKDSVKFSGCVCDKHGARPDPSKVSAIKEMPAPQTKGEL